MRRRLASRRSRSGSLVVSSKPPSTDTLTSTTGSSVCGLSYSSGAASPSSCGVATLHRWRQASPRRALDFIRTRTTSLTWKQSARMLAGEAYGSGCAWTGSCASSALDSKRLSGRKAPSDAHARTCASCAPTRSPASSIDWPTTTRAGTTTNDRTSPVSESVSAPSFDAPSMAFRVTVSMRSLRRRGRPSRGSSSKYASPSAIPGTRRRTSLPGVVFRVARLHAMAPRPGGGRHAAGARTQACRVVCAASSGERTSPTWHSILFETERQRHRTVRGTTSCVDRTSPAVAAADRMAFSVESVTRS